MAAPTPFTPEATGVDTVLTDMSVGWGPVQGMLAPILAPPTKAMDKIEAEIPVWGRESFQPSRTRVGHYDPTPEKGQTVSKINYKCEHYEEGDMIADSELQVADRAFRAEMEIQAKLAVKQAQIMLGWEQDVAELFTTAGNYDTGLAQDLSAPSGLPDFITQLDAEDASPVRILKWLRRQARLACGVMPDTLGIASDAWTFLSTHASLFGGGATNIVLTPEQLASILGCRRVLPLETVAAPAERSSDSFYALTEMWGSNLAFWCVTETAPRTPTTARTFRFNWKPGYVNGEGARRWRTENPQADHASYGQCRDVKAVGAHPTTGKILSGLLMTKLFEGLEES